MEGSQDIQYWYTKPSMLLLYFIIVEVQVREEYPILYSHKTQLNIKLSLLPYYNITTTCFGLNYRPSSGCIWNLYSYNYSMHALIYCVDEVGGI